MVEPHRFGRSVLRAGHGIPKSIPSKTIDFKKPYKSACYKTDSDYPGPPTQQQSPPSAGFVASGDPALRLISRKRIPNAWQNAGLFYACGKP
jgi:hypothetical protein